MFLYQHVQRRRAHGSGVQDHEFFDFGEFDVVDEGEEFCNRLFGLILHMWRLIVEIIFQLTIS